MKRFEKTTTSLFRSCAGKQISAACREGFTILEVLISAGIMVIGLACVASLLPAAAQRMSQAVSEDRAGTLAANAYADITARRSLGLLSVSRSGLATQKGGYCLTLGAIADVLDTKKVLIDGNGQVLAAKHALADSLFSSNGNGWIIGDALAFNDSAGSPVNTFDANNERMLRPNPMCWLATLVPDRFDRDSDNTVDDVAAGDTATISIAVFKKQPDVNEIVKGSLSSSVLTIGGSAVDDDTRRQFVKGCGSVLALGSTPEWIGINASWTDANGTHLICDSSYSGDVVLFTNLLRVEKHRVVLD
jgi:type II secretory pathway pseudopilin PulG